MFYAYLLTDPYYLFYSPFIPLHVINLYNSMCEECQLRRRGQFKGVVVRPILSSSVNSRGHVDLVDMQSMPDAFIGQ